MMLPYYSLEKIKDLQIWIARSGSISGNSVNLLYTFLHLLVMYSWWGVKMSFSSMIIPSTCQQETFLRGAPLIVNGIGGGAGGAFFVAENHVYTLFSWYL